MSPPAPVPFSVSLFAGMVGGAIGVAVSYPLDSAKTKMQALGGGFAALPRFIAAQGFCALYDGVVWTMFGQALIKGALFGSYELAQHLLLVHSLAAAPTMGMKVVAAGAAGAVSTFLVTPIERIKVVMQATGSAAARFVSPLACLLQVIASDGIGGLMCGGFGVTLARQVPTDIFYLLTFERCTAALQHAAILPAGSSALISLIAGAAAGVMAWLPVYPIDVIKTNVQASAEHVPALVVVQRLWQQRGPCAFCEGLAPKLARAVVNHAVTFMVMEQLKDACEAEPHRTPTTPPTTPPPQISVAARPSSWHGHSHLEATAVSPMSAWPVGCSGLD